MKKLFSFVVIAVMVSVVFAPAIKNASQLPPGPMSITVSEEI